MKAKILFSFVLSAILLVCATDVDAKKLDEFERFLKGSRSQRYYLRLPNGYSPDKKYPLFIVIHGYKLTGKTPFNIWRWYTNKEGYVLVCPTFKDGYQWLKYNTDKKMIRIIEEVENKYSIDIDNIFMLGFSGGAQFVHRFTFKYPDYLKAVCVMSAGAYDLPTKGEAKNVKFLVTVGRLDKQRWSPAKRFYNYLRKKGYDVQFKIFPNIGHSLNSEARETAIKFFKDLR